MIYHVLMNVVNDEVSMRFQIAGLKVEVASYKPSNYNMIKKRFRNMRSEEPFRTVLGAWRR
jgi:hypothetical protein